MIKAAQDIILKPVITERSMDDLQAGKYTFKVATDANKTEIKKAVEADYKTKFKGKVNVGLFYTVTSPMDYFEKSVRPHLKQSEDLLGLLNGEVVIESFSNISKKLIL